MEDRDHQNTSGASAITERMRSRITALAHAAGEEMRGIEADREELSASVELSSSASQLVDAVVERVAAVVAECQRLAVITDRSAALFDEELARPEPTLAEPGLEPEPEDEPARVPPSSAARSERDAPRVSEGIRLLATQMSVAGATHDEIARRLGDDFGVDDAESVVAELFGGHTPD